MNVMRMLCGCAGVLLMLAGCASDSGTPSAPGYGPPSELQGTGPYTGLKSFKGTGGWGAGSGSSQPSMPSEWNGSFRGF
jgi:hypothetical protein